MFLFKILRPFVFLTKFSTEPHERIVALVYTPGVPATLRPSIRTSRAQKAEPDFIVKSYQDHEDGWKLLSDAIKEHFLQSQISPWKKWTSTLFAAEQLQSTSLAFNLQWT